MQYSDEEINRFATAVARERCGGCSKTYNEIKQDLIAQLKPLIRNQDED